MTATAIFLTIGADALLALLVHRCRLVGDIRDALFDLLDMMEEGGLNDGPEVGE